MGVNIYSKLERNKPYYSGNVGILLLASKWNRMLS